MNSKKKIKAAENQQRAARVEKAIKGYSGEANDLQANAQDVLTDLRHLCDTQGWDFYALVDQSYQHYLEEKF
jgi:hypothetical protein